MSNKMTLAEARVAASPDVGSTPTGTRTPVPWLRTKYPRPLDDGGLDCDSITNQELAESRLEVAGSFGSAQLMGYAISLPACLGRRGSVDRPGIHASSRQHSLQ